MGYVRELARIAIVMGFVAGCGDSTADADGGQTDSATRGGDTDSGSATMPTATQTASDSLDDTGSTDASATDATTPTDPSASDASEDTTQESSGPATVAGLDTTESSGDDATAGTDTDTSPTSAESSGSSGQSGSASATDDATGTGSASATDDASASGSTGATGSASATDDASASGSTGDDASSATSDSASASDSDSDSDTDGTTGGDGCVIAACGNHLYECGDCEDNDGDVAIDGLDVECVSPCDDDESSFATGIPGDNADPCLQDCFFDGNSGSGNDGCEWDLACDPLNPGAPECPYDPEQNNCPTEQDQDCVDNCEVPNGCDCFGCCTVTVDGIEYAIFIGDDCNLDDVENCDSCTPQDSCGDVCDPDDCELCFGETELPPNCEEPSCAVGQLPCLDNGDCLAGDYCQTGCCVLIPE
jgi:hypothetical protein